MHHRNAVVPAFLILLTSAVVLGLVARPGRNDAASVAVQRADSCRLPRTGPLTDLPVAQQLLRLAQSMERLADSATALVVDSYSKVAESAGEFEGAEFLVGAAAVGLRAAHLDLGNPTLLLEAARLRVRAANGGEGTVDTLLLAQGSAYLTCAAYRAALL